MQHAGCERFWTWILLKMSAKSSMDGIMLESDMESDCKMLMKLGSSKRLNMNIEQTAKELYFFTSDICLLSLLLTC
jgi:hypothetical protein